jgi:hypothetical protein
MPNRRLNSALSSRSSAAPDRFPVIQLIVPPSPRAGALAAAGLLGLPILCLLPPAGPAWLPALACAVAAGFGVVPVRRDLLGRGPRSVRRLCWESDGRFTVDLADGRRETCRLGRGSLTWASGTWLVLDGPRGSRCVFLDASRVDPAAFAALRCRLGREGRRPPAIG